VVDRLAALLHARDVNNGDVVAVFTTNSPEMVVTIYALSKLGAVASLINTSLRGMVERSPSVLVQLLRQAQMIPSCIASMFRARNS
jgi:acyl-CoA synthetase (AMP-forming)/AMP-acid ligase II